MANQSVIIRRLVEESGRSYLELEKITGIKKSTLQRYASGTTIKIPITAIEKLAAAFGVSPRYIMGWTDEEQEQAQKTSNTIAKEKATVKDDGLSKEMLELIDAIKKLPEDKIQILLQVAKSIK